MTTLFTARLRQQAARERQQIGVQRSPDARPAMTTQVKRSTPNLDALVKQLASLANVRRVEIRGLSAESAAKFRALQRHGRDFTTRNHEMELQVARFLRALFKSVPLATIQQIDDAIAEAVEKMIGLRLRNGGGDVRGELRALTPEYEAWKRERYPGSPGIGYASGELSKDFDANAVAIVVRR